MYCKLSYEQFNALVKRARKEKLTDAEYDMFLSLFPDLWCCSRRDYVNAYTDYVSKEVDRVIINRLTDMTFMSRLDRDCGIHSVGEFILRCVIMLFIGAFLAMEQTDNWIQLCLALSAFCMTLVSVFATFMWILRRVYLKR